MGWEGVAREAYRLIAKELLLQSDGKAGLLSGVKGVDIAGEREAELHDG